MRLSGSLTFATSLRSSQIRTRTVNAISQGLTAKTVMAARIPPGAKINGLIHARMMPK